MADKRKLGSMFRQVNGFWVPEKDVGCSAVVFQSLPDLDGAMRLCKAFDVVVQAGGNFGVWPSHLSSHFKTVYTFEPDALNFACLCRNVGDKLNVIKMQAALGKEHGCVDLRRREENAGAHFIEGVGNIPVIAVDDLLLPKCDLIVLDIEGFELNALHGAAKTIGAFHPVIHIEDKGLSEKYGSAEGDAEKWLEQFGYKVRSRPSRDVILSV